MERVYILFNIFCDRNCSDYENTNFCNKFPYLAGTENSIEKELDVIIKYALRDGDSVTMLSSEDIHSGNYFKKVIEIKEKSGRVRIYGISSCRYSLIGRAADYKSDGWWEI